MAIIDYRRTDLRTTVLSNPYWISSGLLVGADCEDKQAVVFSFPTVDENTLVLQVCFQVIDTFTSSTLIDVGRCTLATDAVTTGGAVSIVDADEFIKQTDITVGTAGYYFSATAHKSDWLIAIEAWQFLSASGSLIVGAAATVPAVYVTMTNTGTIAAGTGRVHMLISKLV